MTLFPMKLHMILSDPNNRDIIRWCPDGKSWAFYDKRGLEEVCKQYFKHGSFASFIRSVSGWGFKVRACDVARHVRVLDDTRGINIIL